jgi:type II secretory pathway pseudopilin PulG
MGFTLLEVVVALLLLEVAVLGAVGTLTVASRTLAEAEHLERAVSETEGVLDSLTGFPGAESGQRPFSGGQLEWLIDETGSLLLRASDTDGEVLLEVRSAVRTP